MRVEVWADKYAVEISNDDLKTLEETMRMASVASEELLNRVSEMMAKHGLVPKLRGQEQP